MHTYASVAEFTASLTDGSASTTAGPSIRGKLEAASRRVEDWCSRSRFRSGFGPRIGTNRYSPDEAYKIWLDDDLVRATEVGVRYVTGGPLTTFTEDTDFYLAPFDRTPKRLLSTGIPGSQMVIPGEGGALWWSLRRNVEIAGTWGYSDERQVLEQTAGAIVDTTDPTVTLMSSELSEFSPGQTLWIDDEMLYVRALGDTDTIEVDRGANGSTAATHAADSPIALVRYPAAVVDATLQIASRRWRRRDTNQAQAFGQSGMVQTAPEPGELTILRTTVETLRCLQQRYELVETSVA
jgi:hypothetical protein